MGTELALDVAAVCDLADGWCFEHQHSGGIGSIAGFDTDFLCNVEQITYRKRKHSEANSFRSVLKQWRLYNFNFRNSVFFKNCIIFIRNITSRFPSCDEFSQKKKKLFCS